MRLNGNSLLKNTFSDFHIISNCLSKASSLPYCITPDSFTKNEIYINKFQINGIEKKKHLSIIKKGQKNKFPSDFFNYPEDKQENKLEQRNIGNEKMNKILQKLEHANQEVQNEFSDIINLKYQCKNFVQENTETRNSNVREIVLPPIPTTSYLTQLNQRKDNRSNYLHPESITELVKSKSSIYNDLKKLKSTGPILLNFNNKYYLGNLNCENKNHQPTNVNMFKKNKQLSNIKDKSNENKGTININPFKYLEPSKNLNLLKANGLIRTHCNSVKNLFKSNLKVKDNSTIPSNLNFGENNFLSEVKGFDEGTSDFFKECSKKVLKEEIRNRAIKCASVLPYSKNEIQKEVPQSNQDNLEVTFGEKHKEIQIRL